MSFPRAKITRFNEPINATTSKTVMKAPKQSSIPKYRSRSLQRKPDSLNRQKCSKNFVKTTKASPAPELNVGIETNNGIGDCRPKSQPSATAIATLISLVSDDFKDALEIHNASSDSTLPKDDFLDDEITEQSTSVPIDSIRITSGIPVAINLGYKSKIPKKLVAKNSDPDGSPSSVDANEMELCPSQLDLDQFADITEIKDDFDQVLIALEDACIQLTECVEILEKHITLTDDKEILQEREEIINKCLQQVIGLKQKMCKTLTERLGTIENNNKAMRTIKQLLEKVNQQECVIKELMDALQNYKTESNKSGCTMEEVIKLKERTSQLEKQLDMEKKKHIIEQDKYSKSEISVKQLRLQFKEMEITKRNADNRIVQLSSELRSAQTKMKQMEKTYQLEIIELQKSRHLDKTVIDKLNRKNRNGIETKWLLNLILRLLHDLIAPEFIVEMT